MNARVRSVLMGLLLSGLPVFVGAAGRSDFELSVIVDGAPAPEYHARGRVYLEALKGRSFSLRVSNPTQERMAVALSVDGRNIIDAKRTSADKATKWVLFPGQTVDIPGWQVSGQAARRFFFTETRRSYAKWLGDTSNVGTIEAVFFREKGRPEPPISLYRPSPEPMEDAPSGRLLDEREEKTLADGSPQTQSSRAQGGKGAGPGEGPAAAEPRASHEGALPPPRRDKDKAAREADRFAATGIGRKTHFPVQWVDFDEDPNPVARIALRYEFRPELVRLGVLPQEDELYARDRGRGFERGYAPDPYRNR